MKLARVLLFLWLVAAFVLPCEAQAATHQEPRGTAPGRERRRQVGLHRPQFREAHPFAGGLAQVATAEGKEQLIDGTGKVIWQLRE
jgi:hypothetical protein